MELNKIHNIDCLEFMKTLPDNCIDLVLTDPPYGMNYQSSRRTDKHEKIELDQNVDWFGGFIKEAYRILKDDTHIYIYSVMIMLYQNFVMKWRMSVLHQKEP